MINKNITNNLATGFMQSADRFPNRPALVVNQEEYTYGQLQSMSCEITKKIISVKQAHTKL